MVVLPVQRLVKCRLRKGQYGTEALRVRGWTAHQSERPHGEMVRKRDGIESVRDQLRHVFVRMRARACACSLPYNVGIGGFVPLGDSA